MFYIPQNLLTTQNAKTVKGEKEGVSTYIMYMAPFNQNATGKNVCSHATKGCAESCLFTAGRGKFNNVKKGRTNKANYFFADRQKFLMQLYKEITRIQKKHEKKGTEFAIRLNGTSDLSWEKLKINELDNSIIGLFPTVQFYDYSKNPNRFKDTLPSNYHLTFSRAESNENKALEVLKSGSNVAVVFSTADLPTTWKGYKVIDGDKNDLRYKDDKNVVVGLYAKGDAKKDTTGFVVHV
jgi:hypothetical protein